MNSFIGHVRDSDILTVADSVCYCTFFSCQSNGCSIIVGIRNLWFHQLKYRVPERSDLCFTQRLNELDELLFTISKRQEWSTSRTWNCGNCVSYRYQYDVKNRHRYLMLHRSELDDCLIGYSKDALARYSHSTQKKLTYNEKVSEYNLLLNAITRSTFDEKRLSSFQTCLLFQTLALTGILPLCCYEFSIVDYAKGPYDLIRCVYNSKIQAALNERKPAKIRRTTKECTTTSTSLKNNHTMISEVNLRFLKIHRTLSGKGNNEMSISGITYEFTENILCKISGYLKPYLCDTKESKKNNSVALETRRENLVNLLSDKTYRTLHKIVEKVCDVTKCEKYDSHFFDNGMNKLCNLFRVRPTNNATGPVLEVRSSTSDATSAFKVQYDTAFRIDSVSLLPIFILMYDDL